MRTQTTELNTCDAHTGAHTPLPEHLQVLNQRCPYKSKSWQGYIGRVVMIRSLEMGLNSPNLIPVYPWSVRCIATSPVTKRGNTKQEAPWADTDRWVAKENVDKPKQRMTHMDRVWVNISGTFGQCTELVWSEWNPVERDQFLHLLRHNSRHDDGWWIFYRNFDSPLLNIFVPKIILGVRKGFWLAGRWCNLKSSSTALLSNGQVAAVLKVRLQTSYQSKQLQFV